MNKKIILILIALSLCFSFLMYKIYRKTENESTPIYLIQVGAYKDYNNLSEATKNYENYIVRKEEGLYKIFIGVTKDEEVLSKLLSIYLDGRDNYKKVLKITNEEFVQNLTIYDNIIKHTDNKENINLVVKSSLKELDKILNENNLQK